MNANVNLSNDDDVMIVEVQGENYKRKASEDLNNPPSMKIIHSVASTSTVTALESSNSNINSESTTVNNGTWQILKISFEDEFSDFTNIPWPQFKKSLDKISTTWKVIAISSNQKAVTIKESEVKAISHFLTVNSILVEQKQIKISIKKLQESTNKGIIYNKFLIPIQEDAILELLRHQSVIQVKKIEKQDENGIINPTGSVILVFDKPGTPECVVIDQIRVKVSKLNPRPMQCFHCMKFGHIQKRCLKQEVILCRICFYNHDLNQNCNPNCKNCNLIHSSNSKKCPTYLREIEILKIREASQISYIDAKKLFEETGSQDNVIQTISDGSEKKSMNGDIDELRNKFLALNSDLKKSRENEKLLLVENIKFKEQIVPSLENKVIQLEIELKANKNNHIASINKVYGENSKTLQDLSDQNIEAAKSIEAFKQNLALTKKKLIDSESLMQDANQRLKGFISSSSAVKKEYEKFYSKMNKSGDPLYPARSRSKSP